MRLVRAVVIMVCCVVLAGVPAAASAEILRHRDPVSDVARSPIGSNAYVLAPKVVQGDIVASRVAHARRAIWIRLRLRELTATTNGSFLRIGIASDRRYRAIEIDAFPGHWTGQSVTTNSRGLVVACAVRHRIDYDRNLVTLRVPRTCLGKPRWVRVGLRLTTAGATYAFVDDARASGYSTRLVYGPRIHR